MNIRTLVADVMVGPVRPWPGAGKDADVDYIEIVPEGAVANAGMALARLGVPVSAWAAVGEDNLGRIVRDFVGPVASIAITSRHRYQNLQNLERLLEEFPLPNTSERNPLSAQQKA